MKKDTDIQNLHNVLRSRVRHKYQYFHLAKSEMPRWRAAAYGHEVCQWQNEDRMPVINRIPATHPILEILPTKVSFSKD